MSKLYPRLSISMCLCLFIASIAYGQPSPATLIDTMIQRAFRLGVFNGNVLVIDHDKVIYRRSVGFADATHRQLLTDQYRFHIGSIAKEFNAVAIMLLAEQGKLQVTDKVARYLPGLPDWAEKISILDLLQYTSGLPDVNWHTIQSDQDNMADLRRLPRLQFEPGTNYGYNNNNVFLQRRIIEQISGVPFNTFVEQQLLRPLGMQHAIIDPTERDTLMARGFNNEGRQDRIQYPISGWTAVTLDDFYKWSEGLNRFRLLSPAATRVILNNTTGTSRQAGLGRGSMEGDQISLHSHDGSAGYYQALLVSEPLKGRTVILMVNNRQDNIYDFNLAIQNILDGKPYVQPKKSAEPLLLKDIDQQTIPQFFARYHALKKSHGVQYNFDAESLLNGIGYYLLRKDRVDDAITVFTYNTRLYPMSGNVFDSLGEAYYKKGDKKNALLHYKHSLALDPNNPAARKIVASLEN
ncbi:serine hydrolase [Chitinophaga pendula]|uniref:serine hydrolase n=1 Tax=Chitinophaga TaxID=79328 RepID=UPI000BB090AE|nr:MULTISPECIES: serine hydrolase [Chitinophaga]ASZ12217.1 serine hydrolase [Chitinophaga sp. MD30]UCJ04753.1 serine hydrolase [Chitinophaga pendula]